MTFFRYPKRHWFMCDFVDSDSLRLAQSPFAAQTRWMFSVSRKKGRIWWCGASGFSPKNKKHLDEGGLKSQTVKT